MNRLVIGLVLSTLAALALAEAVLDRPDIEILPEQDYRIEMEELVVTGVITEWRKAELEQELWNRDRFKLAEQPSRPRIEWFPQYTKEERDSAHEPKNRKEEKPEIKLFEWLF